MFGRIWTSTLTTLSKATYMLEGIVSATKLRIAVCRFIYICSLRLKV
jgi:hypothetical protein